MHGADHISRFTAKWTNDHAVLAPCGLLAARIMHCNHLASMVQLLEALSILVQRMRPHLFRRPAEVFLAHSCRLLGAIWRHPESTDFLNQRCARRVLRSLHCREAILGVYLTAVGEHLPRNGLQQIGRELQGAVEALLHHARIVGKALPELPRLLVRAFPAALLPTLLDGGPAAPATHPCMMFSWMLFEACVPCTHCWAQSVQKLCPPGSRCLV